mgnify:CR=1 FL=1
MQAKATENSANYTITASIAVSNKGRDPLAVGVVRAHYDVTRATWAHTFSDAACGEQRVRSFVLQPGSTVNCYVSMPFAKVGGAAERAVPSQPW